MSTLGSIYYPEETINSTDFIGFTFKGTHSSEYGIVRVSGGDRYQESLLPSFSDRTVQVPGGDGMYYFGTDYSQRIISISIAFDSVTEIDLRKMRAWLNSKEIGDLIFDEIPYKTYKVKSSGSTNIQYICFGEVGGERIYKGEGTIEFIAYYPYAICEKKYLSEYTDINKNEWATSAGLLETQGTFDGTNTNQIFLYNPGDIETDFQAFFQFSKGNLPLTSIYLVFDGDTESQLLFGSSFTQKNNDVYLRINSKTELLEGCDNNKKPTGTLYNEYISGGDFFKIPIGISTTNGYTFNSAGANCVNLDYNYLYY